MSKPLVPFVTPDIREEDIAAATKVLRSGHLNEGPVVNELEAEFAAFTGAKHAVACTSGTAALMLAIRAARDVRAVDGSTWISDRTFYGTASAAVLAGEHVELYDDGPGCKFYHSDDDLIIKVHLAGRIAYPAWKAFMVEDCCHALGGWIAGPPCHIGRFSTAGCFSFQSEKLIGIGQGGMVITDHDDIASRIRELKNQGRIGSKDPRGGDVHPALGFNFRMTDYQAALALGQLRRIREKIQEKWEAWHVWVSAFGEFPCAAEIKPRELGEVPLWTDVRFHSMGLREMAIGILWGAGIETRRHYPPLHTQGPFRHFSNPFPHSTLAANTELWLPNNRMVTPEIARRTARIINEIK